MRDANGSVWRDLTKLASSVLQLDRENMVSHSPTVCERFAKLVRRKTFFGLPRETRRERNEPSMIHPHTSPVDVNPGDSVRTRTLDMRGVCVPWGEKNHSRPHWFEDRLVLTSNLLDRMDCGHSPLQRGSHAFINPIEIMLMRRA